MGEPSQTGKLYNPWMDKPRTVRTNSRSKSNSTLDSLPGAGLQCSSAGLPPPKADERSEAADKLVAPLKAGPPCSSAGLPPPQGDQRSEAADKLVAPAGGATQQPIVHEQAHVHGKEGVFATAAAEKEGVAVQDPALVHEQAHVHERGGVLVTGTAEHAAATAKKESDFVDQHNESATATAEKEGVAVQDQAADKLEAPGGATVPARTKRTRGAQSESEKPVPSHRFVQSNRGITRNGPYNPI
jgi:hypothetical protein